MMELFTVIISTIKFFKSKTIVCSLFYELQADERSSDISLSIADDGNLIVGAKQILVLNKQAKKLTQYLVSNHYFGQAFITPNKSVQFHLSNTDSVVVYEKGVFKRNKLRFNSCSLQKESVLKFFSIHRQTMPWI